MTNVLYLLQWHRIVIAYEYASNETAVNMDHFCGITNRLWLRSNQAETRKNTTERNEFMFKITMKNTNESKICGILFLNVKECLIMTIY